MEILLAILVFYGALSLVALPALVWAGTVGCVDFGLQALQHHGTVRGTWMLCLLFLGLVAVVALHVVPLWVLLNGITP